jgi:hypothetical protein
VTRKVLQRDSSQGFFTVVPTAVRSRSFTAVLDEGSRTKVLARRFSHGVLGVLSSNRRTIAKNLRGNDPEEPL